MKRSNIPLTLSCGVCSAPAPEHLHFGTHSCYSCRAFFRRTANRVKQKGLKRCKTGLKKCPVTADTKSCIHCRYNKCIDAGMTPELIQGKRCQDEEESDDEGNIDTSQDSRKKIKEDENDDAFIQPSPQLSSKEFEFRVP